MTLFRANGMTKGNKVDYARAYYDNILDTGKPFTYYQEYHSEMWMPDEGSLSIYTLLQIRPGPRGTQAPAPPPPSDADKLLLGKKKPGFGILEPWAYGVGIIQEWNSSQGYIGRPTKVLPNGRPAPPKWSEMYPLQVPYMPDDIPGKNFSMTTRRNKQGEIIVNRTNRRAPTYHPYLTLTPEFSDLHPTPAGNWRRKHAPATTTTTTTSTWQTSIPTTKTEANREIVMISSDSEDDTEASAKEMEKMRQEDFSGWSLVVSKRARRQAKKVAQEMSRAKASLEKMSNFASSSENDSSTSMTFSQEKANLRMDSPSPPPLTPPNFHELLQQVEVDLVTPSNSETEEEISETEEVTSEPSTGSEPKLQGHGKMDQMQDQPEKVDRRTDRSQ